MTSSPLRSEKLDLRLTPGAKQTLQRAAAATQRSVTDFVLESALASAAAATDTFWKARSSNST